MLYSLLVGVLSIIAPEMLQQLVTVFIGLGFITAGLFLLFYGLGLLKAVGRGV